MLTLPTDEPVISVHVVHPHVSPEPVGAFIRASSNRAQMLDLTLEAAFLYIPAAPNGNWGRFRPSGILFTLYAASIKWDCRGQTCEQKTAEFSLLNIPSASMGLWAGPRQG